MSLESEPADLRSAVVAITLLGWAGARKEGQSVKEFAHTVADSVIDWQESGLDITNWLFAIGIDEKAIRRVMQDVESVDE